MKNNQCKKTSIGGQAVIEGVMMRGKTSMATAVRAENGQILVETSRIGQTANKNKFLKIELDRVDGLDLDAVVEATNIINPILDDADLIKDEYILDISSRERG